jgi:hypothetical protein
MEYDLNTWAMEGVLYKYLKEKHAKKFMKGYVRIGTLYQFKSLEKCDKVRGDSGEGSKEIYEDVSDQLIEDPAKHNLLSPFVKKFVNLAEGAKNTRFINCTFISNIQVEDFYIYCMSKEASKELLKEFSCEVCIEINKPRQFIDEITNTIKQTATFLSLSECVYKERSQKYGTHDSYHPSILKPVCGYEKQKEVRAIWRSIKNTSINHLDIKVDSKLINQYCKIVEIK